MKEYTRQDLIEICEKAFVKEDEWSNRDSESSQCSLGECYALLRARCDFEVTYKDRYENDRCVTNEDTIWLHVYSKGFCYFEGGNKEKHHYYLPTLKRLEEVNGGDWY